MIRIGLTGSIAMGKSEVARILRARGLPLFDADVEVHKLYDSAEGVALLAPLVPGAIVDGKVNRPALSEAVLSDPALLERIEPVIHAEIHRRRDAFFEDAEQQGTDCAVADIPLLFEKGTDRQVDVTIVVSAPEALQRQRALARPGMTPEKLDMILKRQMPDAEKRQRATHVIINDSTLAELEARTLAVLAAIRKGH
jgi:dephospho-CoA kinase